MNLAINNPLSDNAARHARPWESVLFFRLFLAAIFFATAWPASAGLVLTAPPRENAQQAALIYQPVVEFLSGVLNEPVEFKHPSNWVVYLDMLVSDQADIYFSEPHSVGYQLSRHNHRLLVRGPDDKWLVVSRQGSEFRLAGRSACLLPPPDNGHLLFTTQPEFTDNPAHTPYVVTVDLYEDAIIGLIGERCQYAAVPDYFYALFPENYRNQLQQRDLAMTPGQAFTVSEKFSQQTVDLLRAALLSSQGQAALTNLRNRFMNGKPMLPADNAGRYIDQSGVLIEGYLRPMQMLKP